MTDDTWRDSLALAHAARRSGQLEAALAHYHSALTLAPDSAETNSAYGLMLLLMDRFDEAAAPLTRAVEIDPAHPAARINLAEFYARQKDFPSAIRIVESLASEVPQPWWIWDRLGELSAKSGQFPAAAHHFRQAAERKRNDPMLLYKWSRATFDAGALAEALPILHQAARLAPGNDAVLGLYAEIYEASADWVNLGRVADSWLAVRPGDLRPWMHAARAQWETGHLAQAMQSFRTHLSLGGASATSLATYGRLCIAALAYDEAEPALTEAERLDAGCGHMLSARATLSMFRGDFPAALDYARRAIAANPRDTAAFKVLVEVSGGHPGDDELLALKRLSEDGSLRLSERISSSFALADCLDAKGDIAAAFSAYRNANDLSLERAGLERTGYDRDERKWQVDRLISMLPAAPRGEAPRASPHAVPIFIVGMPRSGTTLVESIIGAHSKVRACGERQEMRSIMQEFVSMASASGISNVSESIRQRWRDAFWRELPDAQGATAVTDKNPWNFDALPVIFALFPHARVIHVRRDPVETALSVYRNEFPKFVSFANRLEDIGHYYGEYARLMAHWSAILGERFQTVDYEDLVADFPNVAPGLLRFCGLEWEDACRDFEKSPRIIGTMSSVQARQPLTAFKGRSGPYSAHLSPLVAALRDAGVALRPST